MEFIKKNLVKMIVMVFALGAVVILLVPSFIADTVTFIGASQTIGVIIFFAGVIAFLALKMFEKTKAFTKYVLLGTSILVLTFMSIGLAGFNKDGDKAEGAFGNAYAYFASVESTVAEGEIALDEAKKSLATVNLFLAGGAFPTPAGPVTIASLHAVAFEHPGMTLASLISSPISAEGVALAQVLIGAEIDGIVATTELAEAVSIMLGNKGALMVGIADAEIALAAGKDQINDANAGSLTILFGYIATMIAFGLIPAAFATKKLVCKGK
jgi:hypothetical protein